MLKYLRVKTNRETQLRRVIVSVGKIAFPLMFIGYGGEQSYEVKTGNFCIQSVLHKKETA
jgi:hypothetical protein